MAKSIARQAIGSRPSLARRQIGGRSGQADQGYVAQFPPGSYSFTPPKAGFWKFVLWGPGGDDNVGNGGASGGYVEYTAYIAPNAAVSLVVGAGQVHGGAAGSDTTATFASGKVLTAGAANHATAGAASGGDVNLSGTNGAASGSPAGQGTGGGSGNGSGAAGAPGNLPFRGGSATGNSGRTPAAGSASSTANQVGGDGLLLISFLRP